MMLERCPFPPQRKDPSVPVIPDYNAIPNLPVRTKMKQKEDPSVFVIPDFTVEQKSEPQSPQVRSGSLDKLLKDMKKDGPSVAGPQ
jgi:hypothetical protein